jgi:hypothetical protein
MIAPMRGEESENKKEDIAEYARYMLGTENVC